MVNENNIALKTRSHFVNSQLFCYLGLDLEVLKALYDLVKEKANKLYMWKGVKWTRLKSAQPGHLKVIVIACIS